MNRPNGQRCLAKAIIHHTCLWWFNTHAYSNEHAFSNEPACIAICYLHLVLPYVDIGIIEDFRTPLQNNSRGASQKFNVGGHNLGIPPDHIKMDSSLATSLAEWDGGQDTHGITEHGQCPILRLARFTEPLPDNDLEHFYLPRQRSRL